jgi:hypothetical protein
LTQACRDDQNEEFAQEKDPLPLIKLIQMLDFLLFQSRIPSAASQGFARFAQTAAARDFADLLQSLQSAPPFPLLAWMGRIGIDNNTQTLGT